MAGGLLGFLLRRVVLGALTVLFIAFVTYAMIRVLRPDRYGGEALLAGTRDDLERGFLHFDWGVACGWSGCPPIREMFARGFAADLWLIGAAIALGVGGGLAGAMWCARRAGTRRARLVEAVGTLFYCTPVYVFGLGLLLLFNPVFGLLGIPYFFDAEPNWAQPWSDPWRWLRTFAVPSVVLAAPLGAMCLRLALAVLREEVDTDHVRTAIAKGVSPRRVMARHAAPAAYTEITSFVGVSVPIIVLNLILVERVFGVPGFFTHTYKATGHVVNTEGDIVIDYAMVQAISIWAAVLIVALGIVVDLALVWLNPRIRAGGVPG